MHVARTRRETRASETCGKEREGETTPRERPGTSMKAPGLTVSDGAQPAQLRLVDGEMRTRRPERSLSVQEFEVLFRGQSFCRHSPVRGSARSPLMRKQTVQLAGAGKPRRDRQKQGGSKQRRGLFVDKSQVSKEDSLTRGYTTNRGLERAVHGHERRQLPA
jgi:hypothetical protein